MSITEEGKHLYKETRRILKKAIQENRLVLFVGAGASIGAGMPSWTQAVEQIAEKLPLTAKDKPYDALKIPQYYYNSRGNKEYTQLMRDIFSYGKPLKTTKLHKKIIECQAETIITTNYDHLIEQAAEENGEVRYVISKDSDLPYKNSPRELIKMHGDFENNNFVLKEDDYLQYSRNFKLIETYIKSLIGSKIILFVGYSLNDPDVKQIFSWVKDVLKDDFQRAYILISKSNKNEIERDYFKNLGVNIIYTSELVDDPENKTHEDQLVEVFDYILKDENKKILDQLYDELKPLNELNYVYGKYIRNALHRYYILCDNNELNLSNTSADKEDIKKFKTLLRGYLKGEKTIEGQTIDSAELDKLNTLKTVLTKSHFQSAYVFNDKKWEPIPFNNASGKHFIEELIFDFDYEQLSKLKTENAMRLSDDTPELYMQQAYISAFLEDYHTAYNCLKNASKIYYRNKNYIWYFIAEFNRKYVGKIFTSLFFIKPYNELAKIKTEIDAINLDKILQTLPDMGNKHNSFLKELSSFNIAYTLFYDVFSDSIKAGEEAKTAYTLFAGPAAYEKLRENVRDYNLYETCNYLFLDRYTENKSIFLLYLRSILSSVLAEDLPDSTADENEISRGNIKQEKLCAFDFYIALRYLKQDDFKKLVKEYEIKMLPVDDEAMTYLEKICDSMINANKYKEQSISYHDVFGRYLEILSHIEVSESLAIKILNHLSKIKSEIEIRTYRECIDRFIFNLCNEKYYTNLEIAKAAVVIIDNLLDLAIMNKDRSIYICNIVNNLLYLKNKIDTSDYDDCERVQKLIEGENQDFIISIFSNLGVNSQNLIKKNFENWTPEDKARSYERYCELVLADIIEKNQEIEKQILEWIKEKINIGSAPGVKISIKYHDPMTVLKGMVNLYLNELIFNVDELRNISSLINDKMSQWLLDIEGFDYEQFDCNWLSECRGGLLKKVASNVIARRSILEAYKKQYDSKAVLRKVNDKIITYFIVNSDDDSTD